MPVSKPGSNIFPALLALLTWFALVLQLVLLLQSEAAPVPELLVRYFTFFTILSNILVAVGLSVFVLRGRAGRSGSQRSLSAAAVYIFIVGLTYNSILRFLWAPEGMARVADELLHLVVPVLYLIFWYLYVPQRQLGKAVIGRWLVFPFVYLIVVLVRGHYSGWYPYPFIDAAKIGMQQTLINSLGVTLAFVAAAIAVWFIGNKRAAAR
ncbi:MAG: hypothetical protein EOO09_18185 [Chitinophagaceae bacterium]|nr:MAG: hypothetical protein EOO09_18185 [Chitinophagaceae bacterium]